MATATLAHLLADTCPVHQVDLSTGEGEALDGVSALARLHHYLDARRHLRDSLAETPEVPVLWTSVSPRPLGHARDLLTVLPALRGRTVLGVVHHGDFHRLFHRPATRLTARRLLRGVHAFVFLSESLADRCASWVPHEKRLVVPNTTAPDTHLSREAFEARRSPREAGTPLRLLYLSGMIPSKGYADVLEAVGVLRQRGASVEATFAGRWPSSDAEQAFWARADAIGVTDAVKHLGGVRDRETVRQLYLRADAFVLPTTYPTEAQPLTILEALNAGTPVIATAHASIPEMIEPGRSGLLVPAHSPVAIADAAESLRDPAVWHGLSSGARERYEAAFSPQAVRERWLQVLAALPS